MLIERKTTETIYPSSAAAAAAGAEGRVIELSNSDQIMPRLYTSVLLFYEKAAPEEAAMTVDGVLRRSLEETLSVFYPCAGRFVEREDGGLNVECGGQGALFCVAMADSSIHDCIRDSQSSPPEELGLLAADPPAPADSDVTRLPLLIIQVTHFEGGGMCIGIRLHHNLCDGTSLCHFMGSWSDVAGGKGISAFPCLDRGRLLVHKNGHVMHSSPPPLDRPEYQTTMPALPSSWPEMTSKIFSFTPADISLLKAKAANELGRSGASSTMQSFTAFEALGGHLLRSITRARGLDPAQEVRLGISVDGRRRFDPPLDEGYFGNAAFYGCAASRAGDLVANTPSHAAGMVKEAVAKVSDEYMRSALEWMERQGSKSFSFSFCKPFTDLHIISWLTFPFYELDFGWGTPSLVRIPFYAFDGLVFLLPSPLGEGHIDAFIGLKVEHMSRLESDPELVPT